MSDDTKELSALLDAVLALVPDGPARAKLRAQHDKLKARQTHEPGQHDVIEFASILSHRTKQGLVEFTLNREKTQVDVTKAREIHRMLGEAIEAAISDALIYAFLTQKVGLDDARAGYALLDFRELRQGSRGTVYPT